jgi:hypothetical protein
MLKFLLAIILLGVVVTTVGNIMEKQNKKKKKKSFAKWIGGGLGWALGGPIGGIIGLYWVRFMMACRQESSNIKEYKIFSRSTYIYPKRRFHNQPSGSCSSYHESDEKVMKIGTRLCKRFSETKFWRRECC